MKPDYRHAIRLFVVIAVILGAAVGAKQLAIPDTFGEFGAYRGASVKAAMEGRPAHLGEVGCVKCHAKQVKLHDKDAHRNVQCESCHGPGRDHAAAPKSARMKKPGGKEPCLVCHRRMAARPGAFPQVEWKEHYKFVGVAKEDTPCTTCHNPHEPLFMDRELGKARMHPLVQRCRDCHQGPERKPDTPRPANHPAIFQCNYCHADVVKDFASRSHKKIRCTTCHIFFKESDFAGRIIRDADPRFCLLCHGEGDFRAKDAPPSISWPAHREEMGDGPQDATKRCIDCHQTENIHQLQNKGQQTEAPADEEGESNG